MSDTRKTTHDKPAPSLDGLSYGNWTEAEKLALSCRILAKEGQYVYAGSSVLAVFDE